MAGRQTIGSSLSAVGSLQESTPLHVATPKWKPAQTVGAVCRAFATLRELYRASVYQRSFFARQRSAYSASRLHVFRAPVGQGTALSEPVLTPLATW